MKKWRPASWNQQARRMCDLQVAYVNSGNALIEDALRFFSTSYRAPIIRGRAAKRFGRLLRAGKVKENIEEYNKAYTLMVKRKGGKDYE